MDAKEIAFVLTHTPARDILGRAPSTHIASELQEYVPREKKLGSGVIEIGPGYTGMLPGLFNLDIQFYVGVEPINSWKTSKAIKEFLDDFPQYDGKLSIVKIDALSFLRTQDDNSATVLSSGVLEDCIIGCNAEKDKIVEKYKTELCAEIYRVTPIGGVSIHGGCDRVWQPTMLKSGFAQDSCYKYIFFKN